MHKALKDGLSPILCIGETKEEYESKVPDPTRIDDSDWRCILETWIDDSDRRSKRFWGG